MRVGLYLNNLDEEYQISIFKGIRKECHKRGMELICIQGETLNEHRRMKGNPFPSCDFLDLDGILLLSSVIFDHDEIHRRESISEVFGGLPVVSIGSRLPNVPSIIIKCQSSMRELMEHMIYTHAHRSFLFLGGPVHHMDNIIRERIFHRCIKTARKKFDNISTHVMNGGFHEYSGTALVSEYIEKNPDTPPDAIIAANDNMAIGAMKALYARQDERWRACAVTGFDDIPQARHEIPALTTVHQPLSLMCRLAVRQIYDLISGMEIAAITSVDSYVVRRNSCGCTDTKETHEYTPDDSDCSSLQKEISRIEYQFIRHEQLNRSVSYLGQRLISSMNMGQVVYHLQQFLRDTGVTGFSFILYRNPSTEVPEEGSLILEKKGNTVRSFRTHTYTVKLKQFFCGMLNDGNEKSLNLYHLFSGKELLGLIVYDAPDYTQSHICSGAVFLANTIKRLLMLEEEQERARHLEVLVEERTRDLVLANTKLQEEAQRRLQVEAEVVRISEMERLRFSLDLHDDICQRLAAISMFSKGIQDASGLQDLSEMLEETLQRTRQYAHDSYPVELGNLGLNDALGNLCHTVNKQYDGACLYAWNAPRKSPLTNAQEINVYRIVQEAIQNSMKHSGAKNIFVTAGDDGSTFRISIADDGKGNESLCGTTDALDSNGKRPRGLGLRSMQYRARQIGADYHICSSPDHGTTVEISIHHT